MSGGVSAELLLISIPFLLVDLKVGAYPVQGTAGTLTPIGTNSVSIACAASAISSRGTSSRSRRWLP